MALWLAYLIQARAQGANKKTTTSQQPPIIYQYYRTNFASPHQHYSPTSSDSDKATLSSSTIHTAASQASTTSTRGPCKGMLIGSDFALAFEFFPTPSPLVEEDNEDDE